MATRRASSFTGTVSSPGLPLVQWYDHSPSRIRPALGGVVVRRFLVAIATAGIALGACGGSGGGGGTVSAPTPTTTSAPTQKEPSDQAMARLYELAKPE